MDLHEDRILIEVYKLEKQSSIIDIACDDEIIVQGKVVEVGNLVIKNKVGDKILYEKHLAIPLKFEGKEYFLLRKGDIIATI